MERSGSQELNQNGLAEALKIQGTHSRIMFVTIKSIFEINNLSSILSPKLLLCTEPVSLLQSFSVTYKVVLFYVTVILIS